MTSTPVCVNDYEEIAKQKLSKVVFEYYLDGAGLQRTLKWNKTDYVKYRIRPKYMRKITNRSSSTTILGKQVAFPVGISPTAFHKLAHPDGECATARAAQTLETVFILSMHTNSSLEEISTAAPIGRKWLQMYLFENRDITEDIVRNAETFGYEALVLTIDFAIFGLRLSSVRNNFKLPSNLSMALLDKYENYETFVNSGKFAGSNVTWDDVKWLTTITELPVVVKGVITAEDAVLAVDAGASAVLVSNHGARQLDSLPSTINALPEIVKAVGDRVEVYMDGGIRDGTDIFKALALGAKMVFIGRPTIWGLTYKGEEGVKDVLNTLKHELDNVMELSGCSRVTDIERDMVAHQSFYSKI